ncbi:MULTISPECIES: hypothetical protein [Micromonospora]|uniref:hypothetical protein n=1 Tax=Micromonospora TaxID=1873 RepID=UPI0004C06C1F|nr:MULTISPECIES: hypothetical protein [Micromonospora]MBC9003088.1 hypothetical protein [Micromonospora aurantiaca]MDG4751429.1 hypothetical protein [Micromonospora sp. WMMD718]RNH98449.1 hypothetical protein EEZ25_26400 [Micromonospora aurantiaca]
MALRQFPDATPDAGISPHRPRHRLRLALVSAAAGVLLAVLWSFELVDKVIGDNVANTVLGHDAKETAITGTVAGLLFAFVSGFAGTFTACNIAVAASVGPMSQVSGADPAGGTRPALRALLRPVGWLTLGMVAVSASYGVVGVLAGDRLPQLSTDVVGGVPVRLIQSSVVFGVIGLALTYLGLAALKLVPDVFAHRPVARVVTIGALVGGFLVGRPYPMFNKLFHWAVDTGNPLYGALAFTLQSLGNIVLVTVVFAVAVAISRGRFLAWMADPRRAAVVTGALLVALGVFTVVYWDVRVPALFGFGWFPRMPYN